MKIPVGPPCEQCGEQHVTAHGHGACKAHSKQTGRGCKNPPEPQQAVCADHGGGTPQARRAAGRKQAVVEARAELNRLGVPVEMGEGEAMVLMVREAIGNVAVYRHLVQQLDLEVGPGGIAGRVDPESYRTAPHPFVVAYDSEREKLVRWSKWCLDAGVAERRIRLAEAQAEQLAGVVREVVDGFTGALTAAGVEAGLMGRVLAEKLPGIMRAAFEKAAAIEAGSTDTRRDT